MKPPAPGKQRSALVQPPNAADAIGARWRVPPGLGLTIAVIVLWPTQASALSNGSEPVSIAALAGAAALALATLAALALGTTALLRLGRMRSRAPCSQEAERVILNMRAGGWRFVPRRGEGGLLRLRGRGP